MDSNVGAVSYQATRQASGTSSCGNMTPAHVRRRSRVPSRDCMCRGHRERDRRGDAGAGPGEPRAGQFHSGRPADPLQQLLRLPRSGREASAKTRFHFDTRDGRVRQARRDRARQRRREPAHRDGHPSRSEAADAAARVRARADGQADRPCCADGSTRARSGTRTGPTSRPSARIRRRSKRGGMGAQSDRSVHPRAPRTRGAAAVARSRQGDAAAPRHLRPDRPAADAGRGRRLPRRQVARRLREAGRRAAAVAALRRADGDAVARRGPLRRHARLPHRQPPRACGRGATG